MDQHDPAADFERHEKELEHKEATRERDIAFDELLEGPIEVCGIQIDSKVYATVHQSGLKPPVVYNLHLGDIYLYLPALSDSLVKVDQDNFKTRHQTVYREFLRQLEAIALKKAVDAPDHKWDDVNV